MLQEPIIHNLFEPQTSTWQYVVADTATAVAIVIDPVLDFDPSKNVTSTGSADALLALIHEKKYRVEKILETHVHADHLTAAKYLQHKLESAQGSKPEVCIGRRIPEVQARFAEKYGIPKQEFEEAFDKLLDDDEVFTVGQLEAKAIHLPGHTPDHLGYIIGSNIFCGDSLFNADVGSARCDFPGGDSVQLYKSVHKLLDLPEHYKIWTGHDYPPGGEGRKEPLAWQTVGDQGSSNKHLRKGVPQEEFVKWRNERDAALAAPRLIHQALQFNIRAGKLPAPSPSGDRLLHIPLKVTGGIW